MQAEVDYGSPEQQASDRGHVTIEAPTKDAGDLNDWELLSRNSSPAPERCVNLSRHATMIHVAHPPVAVSGTVSSLEHGSTSPE